MSEEIIKVLDELAKRFGIAIDWSSQNVLPYLQDLMNRFIALKNIETIIWIIVSTIISIISFVFLYKSIKAIIKHLKEDEYYDIWLNGFGLLMSVLIFGFLTFIILAILISNIFTLAQNLYTPEITILNYIKNINI